MFRARNIAKIMMLTAVILLLGMNRYALAQNDPGGPYLNSWHQYSITKGLAAHTATWRLELASNRSTTVALNDGLSWVEVTQNGDGSIEYISIYFTELEGFTITAPNNHWYLVYSEWDNLAPGVCVAQREFEITITENLFYFSFTDMALLTEVCNSRENEVLDGDDVDADQKFASVVEFTINMHKEDIDFRPGEWEFDGQISLAGTGYNLADVTIGPLVITNPINGNATLTDNGNGSFNFYVLVNNPATTDYAGEVVSFNVNLLGPVSEEVDVTMVISGGVARSGTGLATDENTGKPPAPPYPANRTKSVKVLELPKTPNVSIVF
jgi:hypothetical protein